MNNELSPVVRTENGSVCGRRLGALELFVEVPYGAPTGGANRFRPPQPATAWHGVRRTTIWRNRAPQNPDPSIGRTPHQWLSILGEHYAHGMDEDCLTVNIWTPSSSDNVRRPVIVWVHGGGYVVGHATCDQTDGANFAREHGIVFVSVTHRLNAFGFLYLADLAGAEFSASGSTGLLDLVAALEWVQRNIEAFGGDPTNVTVVGESGGAAKISHLLGMPAAQGLFRQAVCESGVAMAGVTPATSGAYALKLIDEMGSAAGDVALLISTSTQKILAAQAAVEAREPGFLRLGPVIDGVHIPGSPVAIWSAGKSANVPLMVGSCRDEANAFGTVDCDLDVALPESFRHGSGIGGPPILPTESGVAGVARALGRDVELAVIAERSDHPHDTERQIALALIGDVVFRRPAIKLAEARASHNQAPTFMYQLDWASPRLGALGACHSTGVPLFFANHERVAFTRGLQSAAATARVMSQALANFARTGDPNHDEMPHWPPYKKDRRVMIFDETTHVQPDPSGALRAAWDDIDPEPLF